MIEQYLNIAQQAIFDINAKDMVIVGGRGLGKGLVQAMWILRNMERMARSCGAIVAPNAKRALTNTIPSMLIHWNNWGLLEGRDYIIGREPPEKWGWPEPYFKPKNYENVISFFNGSIAIIISQDRKGTSNSLSLDWLAIDEAKFINFDRLKDETFPANRGNSNLFGHHYYHHGMLITSDMPVTKKGSWFLKYKDKCNPELVKKIQELVVQEYDLRQRAKKAGRWTDYSRAKVMEIGLALAQLRYLTTWYVEFPSLFNIDILGEDWVRQMKRDLPDATFRTSIMCERPGVSADGFYSCLDESRNLYTSVNEKYLKSLGYDPKRLMNTDCRADADLIQGRQLCIGLDYNAKINCLVVGQDAFPKSEIRVVKSFWVKNESHLDDLVQDFCDYYAPLENKTVVYYYDTTALQGSYATGSGVFYDVVVSILEENGWTVVPVNLGNPAPHVEKMYLINRMFQGRAVHKLLINQENNNDLLTSLKLAGIYNGGKDKRGEKLDETEEDPLETRTDFSDAFDTLVLGMEKHPQDLEGGYFPV